MRTRIRDSDFAVHAVLSRRFAWQTRRNRVHQRSSMVYTVAHTPSWHSPCGLAFLCG
ncbi:hypothetical protein HMPREF0972_01852 [Actinomyces sp. oral taxon 848 str. F0332]|nr:hypothetical protein HMPREF0972_01852 [Actinomyces sp. oral taxon 848 str. F0332]